MAAFLQCSFAFWAPQFGAASRGITASSGTDTSTALALRRSACGLRYCARLPPTGGKGIVSGDRAFAVGWRRCSAPLSGELLTSEVVEPGSDDEVMGNRTQRRVVVADVDLLRCCAARV